MQRTPRENDERSPKDNQIRCLRGLQTLFAHAPYDSSKDEGIAKLRARMEIYDEQIDDSREYLRSIVDIAKKYRGAKLGDLLAIGEEKTREKEKAKALLNYVADINIDNPKHFAENTVTIGKGNYTLFHDAEKPSEPRKHSQPAASSDDEITRASVPHKDKPERSPRGEVSPRARQPDLKRPNSADIRGKLFSPTEKSIAKLDDKEAAYNLGCYDVVKEMKEERRRGDKIDRSPEQQFNYYMATHISDLAVGKQQGKLVVGDSEDSQNLFVIAQEFLDLYHKTYVAGRQKEMPNAFQSAFNVLVAENILGLKSMRADDDDLTKVQEECAKVFKGYLRVNEEKTREKVVEKKNALEQAKSKGQTGNANDEEHYRRRK